MYVLYVKVMTLSTNNNACRIQVFCENFILARFEGTVNYQVFWAMLWALLLLWAGLHLL